MDDTNAKEMMLVDAIETAIEQSYIIIKLKRTIKIVGALNVFLMICTIALALH